MNERPFLLGLTGSIGMGKSTTAQMFAQEGVPVWDADSAVHRLYRPGGAAVAPLAALRPEAAGAEGINRDALKQWMREDETALGRIEAIVHPLVAADRADFIAGARAPIVVLDVPLLFETGADAGMDAVVVVSTPAEVQRARVLAREGMTPKIFGTILAKQMPDAQKRARADHVVETSTLEGARARVRDILDQIRRERQNA